MPLELEDKTSKATISFYPKPNSGKLFFEAENNFENTNPNIFLHQRIEQQLMDLLIWFLI